MRKFIIQKNDAGQRLDRFVAKAVPLLPQPLAQKYIRTKRIKVNGRRADRQYRLLPDDAVQLYISDEFFEAPGAAETYLPADAPHPAVVYEDENILIVDKAPGLLCHSAGGEERDTLITQVKAYLYQKGAWRPAEERTFSPALCNRIDRNTGGLVIAAKNAPALQEMNQKIKNLEVGKYYLCAVHGAPAPPAGTLSDYLVKDRGENRVHVRREGDGAKQAVTRYRTLRTAGGLSLLECRLITGRTHQIRVQLAHMGHPLLGDVKYGGKKTPEGAQALYAYRLEFDFSEADGPLLYLRGKTFSAPRVPFAEKYFGYQP